MLSNEKYCIHRHGSVRVFKTIVEAKDLRKCAMSNSLKWVFKLPCCMAKCCVYQQQKREFDQSVFHNWGKTVYLLIISPKETFKHQEWSVILPNTHWFLPWCKDENISFELWSLNDMKCSVKQPCRQEQRRCARFKTKSAQNTYPYK